MRAGTRIYIRLQMDSSETVLDGLSRRAPSASLEARALRRLRRAKWKELKWERLRSSPYERGKVLSVEWRKKRKIFSLSLSLSLSELAVDVPSGFIRAMRPTLMPVVICTSTLRINRERNKKTFQASRWVRSTAEESLDEKKRGDEMKIK